MSSVSPIGTGCYTNSIILLCIGTLLGAGQECPAYRAGWNTTLDRRDFPVPSLMHNEIMEIAPGFPHWTTVIFLVALSFVVTRRMKIIPNRLQVAFEALLGWIYNLCCDVAGEQNGRRFFPVVCTIFLFVGFNAWLALLPGFGSITVHTAEGEVHLLRPANTDINIPLALALVSFVFVEFTGMRRLGFSDLKKFFNLKDFRYGIGQLFRGNFKAAPFSLFTGAINIFAGFLEGFTEFIRIISLTFRLFGNMTAGEILLLVAAFLVPWLFAVPFYGLELLIGFIQALIFAGLTLIFITIAVIPHEEEAH